MKLARTIATVVLISGLAVGSAQGQSGKHSLKVNVPFRFVIGQTTYTPGQYLVIATSNKVFVQTENGRNIGVLLSSSLDGELPEQNGRVMFECFPDECFLSQVWIAGLDAGRQLPKSKHQIQLAKSHAGQQFALLGTKPQ